MTLGDRVVVMKDGVVQQVGEPLELYKQPGQPLRRGLHRLAGDELRRHHASPSPTRAVGRRARAARARAAGQDRSACGAYSGQRVILGIRPEALRPANGADSADYAFDSVVEVVEPLGSEILLNVRVGDSADRGARRSRHARQRAREGAPRASTRRACISSTRASRSRHLKIGRIARLSDCRCPSPCVGCRSALLPLALRSGRSHFRYGDYSALPRRYLGRRLSARRGRLERRRAASTSRRNGIRAIRWARWISSPSVRARTDFPRSPSRQAWLDRDDCAAVLESHAARGFVRGVRQQAEART